MTFSFSAIRCACYLEIISVIKRHSEHQLVASRSWNFMTCRIVQRGRRMDNSIVRIVPATFALHPGLSNVTVDWCHQINFNVNRLHAAFSFQYISPPTRNSLKSRHGDVASIRKRYTKTSTLRLKSRALKSWLSNLPITCQVPVTLFHSCFQLFSAFHRIYFKTC